MTQSRKASAIEAVANVVFGFVVALLAQAVLFPVVGVQAAPSQNILLALGFTAISLLRSYSLRRLFVWLGTRS